MKKKIISIVLVLLVISISYKTIYAKLIIDNATWSTNQTMERQGKKLIRSDYLGADRVSGRFWVEEGVGLMECDYGTMWINGSDNLFVEGAKSYRENEVEVFWKHDGSLYIVQAQMSMGIDRIQIYQMGWGQANIQ